MVRVPRQRRRIRVIQRRRRLPLRRWGPCAAASPT